MRFPRTLVLVGTLTCSTLLPAQIIITDDDGPRRPREAREATPETPESKKAKAERDAMAESLLNRAYSLTKQTSDTETAFILARLAQASSRNHPQRAKEWAEEVFNLTANLPNNMQRSQYETMALTAMSEVDPEKAIEMLPRLETPNNRDGQPQPEVRLSVTAMLFNRYWQRKGMDGVETLRAAARQMGESGAYPYMAINLLIRQVKSKDAEKSKEILNEALAFFNRRPTAGNGNEQFAMFLRSNREEIPTPLLKDMLEKLVSQAVNLKNDTSTSMVLATESGTAAKLDNAASIFLFQLMPMIRSLDADWAKRLENQYQELRAAADFARSGEQRMMVTRSVGGGPGGEPPRAMMEEMRAMEIDELSARDPQRALKMNAELTDPSVRAASGARLAATISKSDPEQAAELLKKAKEAIAEAKEPMDKLRILVGLAQAQASLNDKAAFEATLQTSYTLGEELFRKGIDKNPTAPVFTQPGFDAMQRLTMSAVRMDYQATMQRLDAVRSPLLQALLLISAAEGLDPDARPRGQGMRIRIES